MQSTRDPATNPVTVLATFDVGQFLPDNFGIVATHTEMLLTFPTKQNGILSRSKGDSPKIK